MLSTYQIFSVFPVQIPNIYRREKESQQYVSGTIIIDEDS